MRVRRLSVVMAFYGVGHVLANQVSGLEAAQKTATVVRDRRFSQNPDQFRVDWEEGKKGLLYLRSGGMRDEANRMQILTDGA